MYNLQIVNCCTNSDTNLYEKKVIKNNAVFLDRDGVINHDYGFVHKIEDFKLRHSVIAGLKFIKQKYFIFIVTNQSGIAKGIFLKISIKNLQVR